MNSKQINFFIHPDDYEEIDTFLMKEGVLIIKQPLLTEKVVLSSTIRKNSVEFDKVYLTNEIFAEATLQNYIANMNYFLVDDIRSLVVELSRGSLNNASLRRSRLYYVTEYYAESDRLIKKDLQFINWANLLIKNFKKEFLLKSEDGNYYSRKTREWKQINKAEVHKSGLTINFPV